MPLDRYARRFLKLMDSGSLGTDAPPDLAQLRRASHAIADFAASAERIERRDTTLPDYSPALPLRAYAPEGLGEVLAPGCIFFHGGGWVSGSLDSHDGVCAKLATEGGCRVLSIGYRLAPEHRFPAALEDCRAAIEIVTADPARFGVDPSRLVVAGDSVGANLAIAAMLERPTRGAGLALQLLLCPVLTAVGPTPSRREFAVGHLIDEATLAAFWEHYRIPGVSEDDPRVSPLRADSLAGLPPAQIHSAEYDPLVDEAELYAQALRRDGICAEFTRHAGLIHHFYGLGRVIPAANEAWRVIGEELRAAFAQ